LNDAANQRNCGIGTANHNKNQKQCKSFVIFMADAIIDPRAVMVHFHDTPIRYINIQHFDDTTNTSIIDKLNELLCTYHTVGNDETLGLYIHCICDKIAPTFHVHYFPIKN
jgi:hypothetical protein